MGNYLVDQGNGTVKDIVNNLTWLGAPFGMNFYGGQWIGEPTQLSWHQATNLFGKGLSAYVRPPNRDYMGPITAASLPLTQYSKGFKHGNNSFSFAGIHNWRLPTLDEMVNLIRDKSFFTEYLNNTSDIQYDAHKELIQKLFYPFFGNDFNPNIDSWNSTWSTVWLANGCRESFFRKKVDIAWSMNLDGDCAIDRPVNILFGVILVCNA